MNYYLAVLKKYTVFNGRARRKEYWYFVLLNTLIVFVLGIIEDILGIAPHIGESVLGGIFYLAVLIPTIAVGVRRMHDVNMSGWYLLIPIYNFILAVTEGTAGDNE